MLAHDEDDSTNAHAHDNILPVIAHGQAGIADAVFPVELGTTMYTNGFLSKFNKGSSFRGR